MSLPVCGCFEDGDCDCCVDAYEKRKALRMQVTALEAAMLRLLEAGESVIEEQVERQTPLAAAWDEAASAAKGLVGK